MSAIRLLIVEDLEDDAKLLTLHLQREGFDLESQRVDNGPALREAMAEPWNAIVCDYSLPNFSGLEALRIVRGKCSETPFIFLSGKMSEEMAIASLKAGAQDYIMKSNLKRLGPALRRELIEAQAKRDHRILEKKLQQLERFESIGRLAGGIAHDFNNVIGVVSGLAQLGEDETQAGSSAFNRFRKIREQAERAKSLTAQLLAFARRQVLQPSNASLNSIITRLESFLCSALGENIELKMELSHELPSISADITQLEQVLMNLCLNARDAMPNGGKIIIETTTFEITDDFNRRHVYGKTGPYVLLTVSDTGIGMDAATMEHIFEPFFTTKEIGKGTGLGLSTVYGIVKQHDSFISVYSEPNEGTTFRIYFPVAATQALVKERATKMAVLPVRGTETVLVAEDNEELRDLVFECLTPYGYTVIRAVNGMDAVDQFEKYSQQIQLVILDMVMPLLNGTKAYEKISAIKPDLPVIFTSGHTLDSVSLRAQIDKGAMFLSKPFALNHLRKTVRDALDH